jgi:hypothetical protein
MVTKGNFCWKMLQFVASHVICIHVFAPLLAMLIRMFEPSCVLHVSFLAYYFAHCLFEKLMLFLALIHALPTKGRKCAFNS